MKTFTTYTTDGQRVQIGFQDACTLYQEVEKYLHYLDIKECLYDCIPDEFGLTALEVEKVESCVNAVMTKIGDKIVQLYEQYIEPNYGNEGECAYDAVGEWEDDIKKICIEELRGEQ